MPDIDLATIALKVAGDLTHLMAHAPPKGIALTIDGRISVAIAGHIAGRMAAFIAAQKAEAKNLQTLERAGTTLEAEKDALAALEEERPFLKAGMTTGDTAAELAALDAKIAAQKALIRRTAGEVAAHAAEQETLRLASKKAASKLTGKLVRPVARLFEKKLAQKVGQFLLHIIPIVDILMIAWDIIDIVQLISQLHDLDSSYAGDREDGGEGSAKTAEPPKQTPEPKPTEGSAKLPERLAELRETLHPAARAIADALSHPGSGPSLDEDALRALDALVPEDLTPAELGEVLAALKTERATSRNDEELLEYVTTAIRTVRDRSTTLSVDGEDMTNSLHGGPVSEGNSEGEGKMPAPDPSLTKVQQPPSGPITQPTLDPMSDLDIVHGFDANLAATWFELRDGQVQLTAGGTAWVQEHRQTVLGHREILKATEFQVVSTGPGKWNLSVLFVLDIDRSPRRVIHNFFVATLENGHYHGMGAANHSLSFEGYVVVDD